MGFVDFSHAWRRHRVPGVPQAPKWPRGVVRGTPAFEPFEREYVAWLDRYGPAIAAHDARLRELAKAEAESVLSCPLRHPDAPKVVSFAAHRAPACAWCAGPLPPRRRQWCSDECWQTYYGNHRWSVAAPRRVLLDGGRCRRCADRAGAHRIHDLPYKYREPGMHGRVVVPEGEQCWDIACKEWHYLHQGRLQVDHIHPREGRGYGDGCIHHLDLLQTLCTTCHGIAGAVRRRWREALEAAARPALPSGQVHAVEQVRLW